ncbi:MAG: hypothetical protein ACFFD1_03070, partial [Candidatus Thorarchaeota archaeon]
QNTVLLKRSFKYYHLQVKFKDISKYKTNLKHNFNSGVIIFMDLPVKDIARWDHIFSTQCAYRSSLPHTSTSICKHLFTNTSECSYYGCPIVQEQYVGFQRDGDSILLISKNNAPEKYLDTWKFETLPIDKKEADKIVEKAVKILKPDIATAAKKKFDHLFQITETIRAAEELETEDTGDLNLSLEKK